MHRSIRPLAIMPVLLAAGAFVAGTSSRVRADDVPATRAPLLTLTFQDETAEAAVRAALARRVAVDVSKLPLRQLLAAVERDCGVPVVVREQALEREGVSPDTPVTLKVSGVTLKSALRWALGPWQLRAVAHQGVLNITTASEAVNIRTSRVYNVGDLVADPEHPQAALEALLKTIEDNTGGDHDGPWPDHGGERQAIQTRTIDGKTLLIIEQTDAVHQEIQQLLRDMRAALLGASGLHTPADSGDLRSLGVARLGDRQQGSRAPGAPIEGAVIRFVADAPDSTARIRWALERQAAVDFRDVPFTGLVETVGRTCGIPVIVNEQALEDEGVKLDAPITLTTSRITLGSALDIILKPLSLRALVVDEVLYITTAADAKKERSCRVYNVTDVTPAEAAAESLERLVQISTGDTHNARWQELHGEGGSLSRLQIQKRELLVIRQNEAVFQEIDRLLHAVRATSAQVISVAP